jgi:uncharacterized membrane-anchored protein
MKTKLFIAASLAVIAFFNVAIFQKEQILKNGETVYMRIVPRDPRSIMQGDYMDLRYEAAASITGDVPAHGRVVIATGADHVGAYAHVDDGTPLKAGEKRMRYHLEVNEREIFHHGETTIMPASYMFQEGQAAVYRGARYAVFKFDGPDNYVLAGLADANLKPLVAPDTPDNVVTRSQNILHVVY